MIILFLERTIVAYCYTCNASIDQPLLHTTECSTSNSAFPDHLDESYPMRYSLACVYCDW